MSFWGLMEWKVQAKPVPMRRRALKRRNDIWQNDTKFVQASVSIIVILLIVGIIQYHCIVISWQFMQCGGPSCHDINHTTRSTSHFHQHNVCCGVGSLITIVFVAGKLSETSQPCQATRIMSVQILCWLNKFHFAFNSCTSDPNFAACSLGAC